MHVTVAGLPAASAPAGPDGWRLVLQSAQLPQRVEAIFRGTLPAGGSPPRRVELPAPSIDGVEVERTLWTVYAPAAAGMAIPPEPTGALSPVRQELARLESNEAVLDLGSHVAGEQSPEEIRRWYSAWNARFVAARDRIQQWSRAGGRASAARDQELEDLSRREQSVAERLGVGPGAAEQAAGPFEAARLLDGLGPRGQEPLRYLSEGDVPSLALRYPHAPAGDFVPRLLVALVVAALGAPGRAVVRRAGRSSWRPWLVLVPLGLLAWLCLEPSALGLIVLLAAIGALLTRRWRSALPEQPTTLPT